MGLGALGSDYWATTFGITTYDEFVAAATPILDAGLPHVGFVDNIALTTAWNLPTTVAGAYITAGLVATGFHEDTPSGPATVVFNSLWPITSAQQQEVTGVAGLVIANCFQVSIQFTDSGHAMENVIGVENASGTAAGAAAAVKAAWEIASGPHSLRSSSTTMVNYHAVDISSLSGTIADLASTTAGGAGAGPLSTRAASALIKWNGSSRARSTRGRMYTGPLREAEINNDGATVASAAITALNTAFTNFRNSLGTAGYPLVVLSRQTSTATIVTQHSVESTIATQRRRIRV
jgi:hypothetical protein